MAKAIIDASNMALGRMASVVAKRALKGESIEIVNSEKCFISGGRKDILGKFQTRQGMQAKGNPNLGGPKYPRMPHMIVKRAIRGMLPYKRERGRTAFKNIIVHIGIPKELEGQKFEVIEDARIKANASKMGIDEISRMLGARW